MVKSKSKKTDPTVEALQWIASFDGVVWLYEGGYAAKLEIKISELGVTEGQPEGVSYSFTFHEPGVDGGIGKRIYGIDNAHSPDHKTPWDHVHPTVWPKDPPGARPRSGKGERMLEPSIQEAFSVFPEKCKEILLRLGLGVDAVGQSKIHALKDSVSRSRRPKGVK